MTPPWPAQAEPQPPAHPRAPARRDALVLGGSLLATAVLAGAGQSLLRQRAAAAPAAARIDLERLVPRVLDGWREEDGQRSLVRPPELQGRVYGLYDQVLERAYTGPSGERVMLSMAYGAQQSHTLQLHRPEVCYEAAGFEVSAVQAGALQLGGRTIPVTRMRGFKPGRPEPVTYWTVLGDEVVAGRRGFKWGQLTAAWQGRPSSGLLVRLSSIDEDAAAAYAVQARFAAALADASSAEARAALLGSAAGG